MAEGAEEDEALAAGEVGFVVGGVRVDPEFQHAARRVQGAGHGAFPFQFAHVADVHEAHVRVVQQGAGLFRAKPLDARFGGGHQLRDALLQGHEAPPLLGFTRRGHQAVAAQYGGDLLENGRVVDGGGQRKVAAVGHLAQGGAQGFP